MAELTSPVRLPSSTTTRTTAITATTSLSVDLRSGEPRWTFRDRNFPYFSSPAVSAKRVVIGGRDRRLHGLHRETGEPAWVFASRGRIDSSPVIVGDKVVVGSDDGRLYM
jgi:eukaryotic-like serine/threonine-protein kinase